MQLTVTKEEAKEIIESKLSRLSTGVEKVQSLVKEDKWIEAQKVLKALPEFVKGISDNVSEAAKG